MTHIYIVIRNYKLHLHKRGSEEEVEEFYISNSNACQKNDYPKPSQSSRGIWIMSISVKDKYENIVREAICCS